MRGVFVILLFVLSLTSAYAQKKELSGEIVDDSGLAIPYCNVVLKQLGDSSIVAGCVTSLDGKWQLKVGQGEYWLSVSYIGYNDFFKAIKVEDDTCVGKIVLEGSSVALEELVVVGQKNVRQAGSNVYYLSNSPKTVGRNALEVVSLASGVSVDKNKGLKIYGKEGVRVMIDNRMVEMTGAQLTTYIANIKGEDIASVEVLSTANATFDANATGGVIKINLKNRGSDGYNLSAGMKGSMFGSRFMGINPDVSFNMKTGKLNVYGNLAYNSVGWQQFWTEQTNYLGKNENIQTNTTADYLSSIRNWFGRAGLVYSINEAHSLGVDLDATLHRDKEEIHTPSTVNDRDRITDYWVDYYTPDSIKTLNLSFNYNWKTDIKGSNLNIGSSYYHSSNNISEDNTLKSLSDASFDPILYHANTSYARNMYTAGVNYKWVASSRLSIDFGAKFNQTNITNNLKAFDKKDGEWIVNKENTDNYSFLETIWAGYVNSIYKLDKWTFNAGLRYEQTVRSSQSDYFIARNTNKTLNDFFPVVSVTYDINKEKGHSLTLNSKSGIKRPSFEEMVPYSTQQNLYSFITGNLYLRPSYNYSLGLDLLLFNAFYWGLNYSQDKDNIELMMQPRQSGSLIIDAKYDNVPEVRSYQTMAYIPVPVCKAFYIGFELSLANKERDLSPLKENIWQFYCAFDSEITLPKSWSVELEGNYVNREFYGNSLLKNYYTFGFGVKRSFFDNRLQLAVTGTNVFGRKKELEIDNIELKRYSSILASEEAKCFSLSIRYVFNSNNKMKENRVKGINRDERER